MKKFEFVMVFFSYCWQDRLKLSNHINFKFVLYVPKLVYNLLINKLSKDSNYSSTFIDSYYIFEVQNLGMITDNAREINRLYYFDETSFGIEKGSRI